MRALSSLLLALAACRGSSAAPSTPAATYAVQVNACVALFDAQADVDACRAEARRSLCAAEPALCDGGSPE